MRPFIAALNGVSNWVLRRFFRIDADARMEEGSTPKELRAMIAQARAGGKLDPGEAGMLSGVFHLHEQEARNVMTPIPAVITVDVSEDVETALRRCISSGHTRLLVTEDENKDRVRGIVHANSLARLLMTEGGDASFENAVRDAPIVPETKPLDDLLADLQRARSSMAVVIDEYGRVAGIVTVEDIIEEVVGEIDDETDPAGGEIRQLANGDWYVRGHVAVTDLQDYGLVASGRHRRLQLGRRLRLRASSGGCRAAATPCRPTATRSGSSRSARTGSRRCASATAAPSGPDAGVPDADADAVQVELSPAIGDVLVRVHVEPAAAERRCTAPPGTVCHSEVAMRQVSAAPSWPDAPISRTRRHMRRPERSLRTQAVARYTVPAGVRRDRRRDHRVGVGARPL